MIINIHNLQAFLADHISSAQILLFAVIVTSLWFAEKMILAESVGAKWRHTSTNAFLILFALPLQFIANMVFMAFTSWEILHHWGLVYFLPNFFRPWMIYVLMFFVLDFLDYVYHRSMHNIPWFWKFHLVHHTDKTIDVSSTLREHPGETFLRNCFMMGIVFVFGAPFAALLLRQTVQTLTNILSHTSFRLPPISARIFGWIFITPNLHHVHHHFKRPYTDRNYGDTFSMWDRLFGTFAELSAEETIFGLDTHMKENMNACQLVALPVLPQKFLPANGARRSPARGFKMAPDALAPNDMAWNISPAKGPSRTNMVGSKQGLFPQKNEFKAGLSLERYHSNPSTRTTRTEQFPP